MNPTETSPPLRLWKGETVHVRFRPIRRNFRYAITLIDLDIDRLDEAGKVSRLMRIDRSGLFGFCRKDHGSRGQTSLREWAESQLSKAGVALDGGVIRLISFPRHLFYRFAPISIWLSYDKASCLNGVIYEVNNTFGETHSYASRIGDKATFAQHQSPKSFHVSPFMDIDGDYRFSLLRRDNTFELRVDNVGQDGRNHTATISATARKASTAALLKTAVRSPLSSLGVTFGIHWQAVKVWSRGIAYRRKPQRPENSLTVARPLQSKQGNPDKRQAETR